MTDKKKPDSMFVVADVMESEEVTPETETPLVEPEPQPQPEPEPEPEPAAASTEPELAEFQIGYWNTVPNFKCPRCNFKVADRNIARAQGVIREHLEQRHPMHWLEGV